MKKENGHHSQIIKYYIIIAKNISVVSSGTKTEMSFMQLLFMRNTFIARFSL